MSLQDELAERLAQGLRARLARFDPRVLSWLVLLPEWTAARWPFDDDLIRGFDASGLIEQRDTFEGGAAFWVRDRVRPELAAYVREMRGASLEDDVAELARSSPLGTLVRYRGDPSGQSLMDDVERLLGAGNLGEATRLTAGARLLGEVLNEPLADSARRARWRIDRAIRIAEDQRLLKHYVHRTFVADAFSVLLEPGGDRYALHLLGDGGTGKTMALRYLCGTSRFPVARIDFDYLDPRYPDQRPGEILLALAGELLGYGTTRGMYRWYRRLQDAVDAVHEELASDVRYGGGGPALTEMTGAFADFVTSFGQPVVLVLDTCEELAKLYLPGAEAPAIDQTFAMLEQVHGRAPAVRFVLAGRRWLVPPADPATAAGGPRLRPRPYLRVLAFTGFTQREARAFTRMRQVRSEPMIKALLNRAAAPDGSYNPFELSAYCQWAVSDPGLDPAELAVAPGDPLVERRIIGRTGEGIRPAVPVAAALGQFDLDLIAPGLDRAGLDPETAFRELSGQEWVNVLSVDASGRPRVIEVNPHLRTRILEVAAAGVDRQALGRDAVAAVDRSELPAVPVSTVQAAVRLLPAGEAGEFWARLERRVAGEHAWGWAAQATTAAGAGAAEADRSDGDGPTILAAILATQAATRIRTGGDVLPLWHEVQRYAGRHPDTEQGQNLMLRGMLGRLAAGDQEIDADSVPLQGGLEGSYLAAAQRLVADGRDATRLVEWVSGATEDWRIRALATSLLAVLELWRRDSRARFTAANAEAHASAEGPTQAWTDWVPPRRVADRCRLTCMFIAFVTGALVPSWRSWRDEAIGHLDDIDAERLVSLSLRYERGFAPVPDIDLWRVLAAESYAPRRAAEWLHFEVRPLLVEIATQRWTDRDGSLQMLQERIEEAVAAGDDPDTVDACQLAQMRLCRRHRYVDPRVLALSHEGSHLVRAEAWLVRRLVSDDGAEPAEAGQGIPAPRSFDPEQILSGGGTIEEMPPGERGRAGLAVGEMLALVSPDRAIALLRAAAEHLTEAGDDVAAAQADILRVLASGRVHPEAERSVLGSPSRWEIAALPSTWETRREVARRLIRGEPLPEDLADPSPELRFSVRWPSVGVAGAAQVAPLSVPVPVPAPARGRTIWRLTGAALALGAAAAGFTIAIAAATPASSGPSGQAHLPGPGVPPWVIIVPWVAAFVTWLALARLLTRRRRGLRLVYGSSVVTVTPYRAAELSRGSLRRVIFSRPVQLDTTGTAPLIPALDVRRKGSAIFWIDAGYELESHPWEQWLGRSWPQRRPAGLLFFRSYGGGSRYRMHLDPIQTLYAYRGPAHILLVTALPAGNGLALHLIGTPVSTRGGWRLRVAGMGTAEKSRGTEEGESLVSPASLSHVPPVVILQADPVDGDARALGADRPGFIRLAREFAARGASAVFVIPPLDDALALAVAERMRDSVTRLRTSPRAASLFRLLADLKQLVASGSPTPVAGEIPALDVLLFLNLSEK